MKHLLELWLSVFLLLAAAGCAITHEFGPYYGKVVDAETKEPIEGAAVLVVFYTSQVGLAGSVAQYEDAKETLTDKNGEFRIPETRVNTFKMLSGWEKHPEVRIFKPGYGCYPRHKWAIPKFEWGSLPANRYVTIELPMLQTREERLENIDCFPGSVPDEKMRRLIDLNNYEAVGLGLKPIHVREEGK